MITFEQVAKIEALRRQIEQLQGSLSSQANYTMFGWQNPNNSWRSFEGELNSLIRDTVCKYTTVKILKLLDESERLGVDVSKSKGTLLEFLEEIKPKESTDELR